MKKLIYIAANIMAPGMGHFAMKRWKRGLFYFLGTALCLVWLIIAFKQNVIPLYYGNVETNDSVYDFKRFLLEMLLPIVAIFLIWLCSYIDLFFFSKPLLKKEEKGSKPE